MAKEDDQTYLVDGIKSIGTHNGIVRIQFFRLNADGQPSPAVELAVSTQQIKGIADAIQRAATR